jgi:hypothetical protein
MTSGAHPRRSLTTETRSCHLLEESGEQPPLSKIDTRRVDAFRERMLSDG